MVTRYLMMWCLAALLSEGSLADIPPYEPDGEVYGPPLRIPSRDDYVAFLESDPNATEHLRLFNAFMLFRVPEWNNIRGHVWAGYADPMVEGAKHEEAFVATLSDMLNRQEWSLEVSEFSEMRPYFEDGNLVGLILSAPYASRDDLDDELGSIEFRVDLYSAEGDILPHRILYVRLLGDIDERFEKFSEVDDHSTWVEAIPRGRTGLALDEARRPACKRDRMRRGR